MKTPLLLALTLALSSALWAQEAETPKTLDSETGTASVSSAQARRLGPENIDELEIVSSPAISPDGNWTAYIVSQRLGLSASSTCPLRPALRGWWRPGFRSGRRLSASILY